MKFDIEAWNVASIKTIHATKILWIVPSSIYNMYTSHSTIMEVISTHNHY